MSKKIRSEDVDYTPINSSPLPLKSPTEDRGLVSEYQRMYGAVAHGGEEIRIPPEQSLYNVLERRGLLERYRSTSYSVPGAPLTLRDRPSFPEGMGVNL